MCLTTATATVGLRLGELVSLLLELGGTVLLQGIAAIGPQNILQGHAERSELARHRAELGLQCRVLERLLLALFGVLLGLRLLHLESALFLSLLDLGLAVLLQLLRMLMLLKHLCCLTTGLTERL
ncbi:hypothetical protein LZV00_01860 [Pseudomonas kielensis]|uniref:hypothetical protein n=1 Tax=Pseudomonas kielensis TaxID=2762577 RepID=UPI00224059D9|nr:hypothetical protein [Pseudomonas kielensis]UZM14588.1 hypothetical protein LZV00_01860 [Pseudomonas kielensis]